MKGQMQQIFVFIMVTLMAGLVLFLGYKGISLVFSKSCDVERAKFIEEFKQGMDVSSEYGRVETRIHLAPCEAIQLCFVDGRVYGAPDDGIYNGHGTCRSGVPFTTPTFGENNRILDMVSTPSTTPSNVFLVMNDDHVVPFPLFEEGLRLPEPCTPLCINTTTGRFRFRTEGRGSSVRITR